MDKLPEFLDFIYEKSTVVPKTLALLLLVGVQKANVELLRHLTMM